MANTIIGGTPVTPFSGNTLDDNINRWRLYLDDTQEPYIWSNEEFTAYCNNISNLLCASAYIIEDSTSALTQISIVAGTPTYAISDRIVSIIRATLANASAPLSCVSTMTMDSRLPGWYASDATSDTPHVLVTQGLGSTTVRLYPIPSANTTLQLTVRRLPTIELVYSVHASTNLEIPARYSHLLDNGVYWKAYGKQDADARDRLKMEQHEKLWKQDLETAKRSTLAQAWPMGVIISSYGDV